MCIFRRYATVIDSPLLDPLHYQKDDMTLDDTLKIYTDFCASEDQKDQKLAELAQERQEDFYGKWVGEMVRIAKVSSPLGQIVRLANPIDHWLVRRMNA